MKGICMKVRFPGLVCVCLFTVVISGCTSQFLRSTQPVSDDVSYSIEPPVAPLESEKDSANVEASYFEEEEALLARILDYYDEALAAYDDADYGFAETKLDSAAVLASEIDLNEITDDSLSERYRNTLAALFQEYGKIFNDVDRIKQEEPLAWLDELTASDPEQFKNGKWEDDELKKIVRNISLRCDVPIDYNDQVKKAIHFFQTQRRNEMVKWQERSGRYLTMMHEKLEEEDLPLDIAYLSMIESGFSPKAYSRARASGLWQFMYSTGRLYGLTRTEWLDERRDPIKSTQAAVQHLKDLYKMYGDWRLVLAAYNCGPARVSRQFRAGNDDFWTMNLPRETKNYVPSVMAAVIISKAPELFGFEDIDTEIPLEFDLVEVHPYTDLTDAAACAGVDLAVIKDLNTELLRNRTPAGKDKYSLRIPKDTKERFITAYAKIPEEKYNPPRVDIHVVRSGETLSGIAEKYKVSLARLMTVNSLSNSDARRLRVGRQLRIPGTTSSASSSSKTTSARVTPQEVTAASRNTLNYTVRKNDSLWLIANRYNTSASMLQALNKMGSSSKIIPGQVILVPQGGSTAAIAQSTVTNAAVKSSEEITYVIKRGDTLYEIAQKYNVSHKEIMEWNKIKNHRIIRPGQRIVIKNQTN